MKNQYDGLRIPADSSRLKKNGETQLGLEAAKDFRKKMGHNPRFGAEMLTKADHVQSVFERPARYLSRRAFEIRIRAETVKELTEQPGALRILDIGCGDGSISLPLLTQNTHITLVDLSSSMLSIARSKVPQEMAENVETVNQDFGAAEFNPRSFDLILCIGVLAHVASPADFIAKMVALLRPGGSIIVECTDSRHILTRLVALFAKAWSVFRPTTYALNAVSYFEITEILERYRFRSKATFRYVAPLPGSYRLFSQEFLYKITRRIFGAPGMNRNAWLGNEYIGMFGMDAPIASSRVTRGDAVGADPNVTASR